MYVYLLWFDLGDLVFNVLSSLGFGLGHKHDVRHRARSHHLDTHTAPNRSCRASIVPWCSMMLISSRGSKGGSSSSWSPWICVFSWKPHVLLWLTQMSCQSCLPSRLCFICQLWHWSLRVTYISKVSAVTQKVKPLPLQPWRIDSPNIHLVLTKPSASTLWCKVFEAEGRCQNVSNSLATSWRNVSWIPRVWVQFSDFLPCCFEMLKDCAGGTFANGEGLHYTDSWGILGLVSRLGKQGSTYLQAGVAWWWVMSCFGLPKSIISCFSFMVKICENPFHLLGTRVAWERQLRSYELRTIQKHPNPRLTWLHSTVSLTPWVGMIGLWAPVIILSLSVERRKDPYPHGSSSLEDGTKRQQTQKGPRWHEMRSAHTLCSSTRNCSLFWK